MWKMRGGVGLKADHMTCPGSAVIYSLFLHPGALGTPSELAAPGPSALAGPRHFHKSRCFSWSGSLSRSGSVACQVGGGAAVAVRRAVLARSPRSSFIPRPAGVLGLLLQKARNLSRCGGEVP